MTAQVLIMPDGTRVNAPSWWIDQHTINQAKSANRKHRNARLERADAHIKICPHCDARTIGRHNCQRRK